MVVLLGARLISVDRACTWLLLNLLVDLKEFLLIGLARESWRALNGHARLRDHTSCLHPFVFSYLLISGTLGERRQIACLLPLATTDHFDLLFAFHSFFLCSVLVREELGRVVDTLLA